MAELNLKQIKEEMAFACEDKPLYTNVKKKKQLNIYTRKQNMIEELEIKKMKQGMSYTGKEKTIILNVFKYFKNQHPEKCVTDIVRRTAKATGCSEKSVFQFRKEESSVEGFKEPSKTKIRNNININSRDIKYDNSVRTAIRNIIYELKFKNVIPSLNTILKQINADSLLPKFSVMTLRRLMFDMGFSYQKNGNKFVLIEKPDSRPMDLPTQQELNNDIPQKQIQQIIHNQEIQQQTKPHVHVNLPAPTEMRLNPPAMQMPIRPMPPQNEPLMMGPPPPEMLHPHPQMIHKSMPMMMNPRRDMMPPHGGIPPMDMQRKRDPMTPWMHGIIKQGQ